MATAQPTRAGSSNGSAKSLQVYQGNEITKYVQEQVAKFGKYTAENAIIVAPQIEGFVVPANHVPHIAVVQAHWSDVGDKVVSDDIYPQAGGKYSLLKHMIERLAEAAGVRWDPDRCRVTRYPNRDVLYEAVGTMQSINGQIYTVHGTKLIERQTDVDEVRLAAERRYDRYPEKNPKPGTDKFELKVREDLLEKDKHRVRMAESKAKLAALRERLNLKATYTLAELRKPFVVPRLTFQPDYSDPEVRRLASAQAMGLTSELYGAQPSPRTLPAAEDEDISASVPAAAPRPHVVAEEPDEEPPVPTNDAAPPSSQQPGSTGMPPSAPAAAPTSNASPPGAGSVEPGPASNLSEASQQILKRVRDEAESKAKKMSGDISVPQLDLLKNRLKNNEPLVTAFFPDVTELRDLTRGQASALIDWLMDSTQPERHAFADEVRSRTQASLPLS